MVYKIAAAFRSLGDPTFTETEKREASIKKKEKNGICLILIQIQEVKASCEGSIHSHGALRRPTSTQSLTTLERETRRSLFYSLGILKGLLCVPRFDLLD